MNKNIVIILAFCLLFAGCSDLFDPANENIRDKETIYDEPGFAEGLLLNGYLRLPYEDFTYSFNDVATDDAVSNDPGNSYFKMATGQWRADNNPVDVWTRNYNAILYLNLVIAEADSVHWAADEQVSKLFNMRIKGEAYALRAIFMYFLVQAHAGYYNGQLLGVPVITDPVEKIPDFNFPRADFKTCINVIYSDMTAAESYLPLDYAELDLNTGNIPEKYRQECITEISKYNRVLGEKFRGRMTGRIVKAFRAKLALLAASPAYLDGADNSWADAAKYAAEVLEANGGLAGLAAKGWTWYTNADEMSALQNGSNPPEIIWRGRSFTHSNISSTIEKQHFPPTLYGNGRLNPTQNLVDAFPMANGYPISDTGNSGYDPANPYSNRDPRLNTYILVNGSAAGPANTVIDVTAGNDAVGATSTSTITGYYMKKLLNQKTNLNPSTPTPQPSYIARIRYTEMFLIYAEAANEAYGADGTAPGVSYSARDVIRAIRQRAGVGGTGDAYLASVSNEEMKELIHNERRLELCFEGHRFWDLRRWKVSLDKLNEPVRGIKGADGQFDFSGRGENHVIEGQNRLYKDYMFYGPVPYGETLKWSNLFQNDGWQ
jgi:hypothetical protein